MSDLQKRIVYSVLSAAVTAAVSYLSPVYREAALALFASLMGALHFTKPGDVKPEQLKQVVAETVIVKDALR